MGQIREWSVKMVAENHQNLPRCSGGDQIHDAPAGVLFSAGAYFGNYFHAFTDVLVALFVTAHPFNREVVLLVTDGKPVHVDKFKTLFNGLSRNMTPMEFEFRYPTIDIDKAGRPAGNPRCFSRLTIGLKGRDGKELSINSEQSEYTMADFKRFLRSAYSLKRTTAVKLQTGDNTLIPRLLIISREKTRIVTNVGEIENLAREIGYRVTVGELDDDVSKTAEFTNGFDVMMGVHGAGLTNMVFLPEDAVVIQVVPFAADWVSGAYFGEPAEKMGLRYLEYKIGREESSLMRQYPPDDVVFTDPASFRWEEFSPIYLQNQNVTVDVTRFKPLLVKGLELLHE
ncbi:unnamed protein product [Linum tenue]|uniref:Glycosyltransferase 61 catalytic domain-containing protein n=1 Tax=Linum tenue TaxID=586396 RepID=A0AAV0MWV3_9ROSI|nr:unnamed protein product [Linum tenue]